MVPILNPAGVQELIDYGLYGYAMSRFAGTWAAIKCVKDNIESTASVDCLAGSRPTSSYRDFDMPPGGLNIRHEIDQLGQEERLHEYKRAAASAFIRANGLNRIVYSGGRNARLGIITVGKSYLDVRQALDDLGIDEAQPTASASGCSRSARPGRSTSSTSPTSSGASKRSSWSRRSAR